MEQSVGVRVPPFAMMVFLFFIFLFSSLTADVIDPQTKSFSLREKKKAELFEFSAEYPELYEIDIDGKRKVLTEIYLTGSFPVLESLTYEGGIGSFKAEMTGNFPKLKKALFSFVTADTLLDLRGHWTEECTIIIQNRRGNVTLWLPEDVAVEIITKTEPLQAQLVIENPQIKKKGLGIRQKTYLNARGWKEKPLLHLIIQKDKGQITLR